MFRLLCIATVLASVAVIVWLIVELRADKRDQERYEATDLHGRLPLRDDL